eukprot:1550185-Ditylum_brightwellii.AAC.1
MCSPSGLCTSTGPVQLDPSSPEDEVPVKIDPIQPHCVEKIGPFDAPDRRIITWDIERPLLQHQLPVTAYNENPTEEDKKEMISDVSKVTLSRYWDDLKKDIQKLSPMRLTFLYREVLFQLPKRNGYVVEFNNLQASLTGFTTPIQLLGNSVMSKLYPSPTTHPSPPSPTY